VPPIYLERALLDDDLVARRIDDSRVGGDFEELFAHLHGYIEFSDHHALTFSFRSEFSC
jgi:hypothetical protein